MLVYIKTKAFSKIIKGPANFLKATSANMGIDFRRSVAGMPRQFLYVAQIGSGFQQYTCLTSLGSAQCSHPPGYKHSTPIGSNAG